MSRNKFILHILLCLILAFHLEGRPLVDEKSECAVILNVERIPAEPKLGFRVCVVMMNWETDSLKHLFAEIDLPWDRIMWNRGPWDGEFPGPRLWTLRKKGLHRQKLKEVVFIGKSSARCGPGDKVRNKMVREGHFLADPVCRSCSEVLTESCIILAPSHTKIWESQQFSEKATTLFPLRESPGGAREGAAPKWISLGSRHLQRAGRSWDREHKAHPWWYSEVTVLY